MQEFIINTQKKKQVVDITDTVTESLRSLKRHDGSVSLFITHTTAALTTADLDPGTDLDMLDAFEKIIPNLHFRHPHNPVHAPDHILSSLIGASLTLPVNDGQLVLGTWQRVVLVEFDGPRQRRLIVS